MDSKISKIYTTHTKSIFDLNLNILFPKSLSLFEDNILFFSCYLFVNNLQIPCILKYDLKLNTMLYITLNSQPSCTFIFGKYLYTSCENNLYIIDALTFNIEQKIKFNNIMGKINAMYVDNNIIIIACDYDNQTYYYVLDQKYNIIYKNIIKMRCLDTIVKFEDNYIFNNYVINKNYDFDKKLSKKIKKVISSNTYLDAKVITKIYDQDIIKLVDKFVTLDKTSNIIKRKIKIYKNDKLIDMHKYNAEFDLICPEIDLAVSDKKIVIYNHGIQQIIEYKL